LNIQEVNESYNESSKLIERIYDTYKEFIENYPKINRLGEQQFEDMQRVNQQWFNLFLGTVHQATATTARTTRRPRKERRRIKSKAKNPRLISLLQYNM
jgi:hypothetical protein